MRFNFRVGKDIGRELAKPPPDQFFLEFLALGRAHARQDDHGPAARPCSLRRAIYAPRCCGKALAAVGREMVLAAFAGAPSLQPALLRQPRSRGPHQSFIETEGGRQADQAAKCDGAAPRHDGVAEDGHDQRSAAQRPLTAIARDQLRSGSGSGGVSGHFGPFLKGTRRVAIYDTENVDFVSFVYQNVLKLAKSTGQVCIRKRWIRSSRRRRGWMKMRSNGGFSTVSTPRRKSSPRIGCRSATAIPWFVRSPSTPIRRSSACCRKAIGSRARRRSSARRSSSPKSRMKAVMARISTARPRPWA